MTSGLSLSDRQGARTVALETSLLLRESHQQYLIPANRFTLGYNLPSLSISPNLTAKSCQPILLRPQAVCTVSYCATYAIPVSRPLSVLLSMY